MDNNITFFSYFNLILVENITKKCNKASCCLCPVFTKQICFSLIFSCFKLQTSWVIYAQNFKNKFWVHHFSNISKTVLANKSKRTQNFSGEDVKRIIHKIKCSCFIFIRSPVTKSDDCRILQEFWSEYFSGRYIRWLWNSLIILKTFDKPKSWQIRFGVTKILTNYKVPHKQKMKYVDIEARVGELGLKKVCTIITSQPSK